MTQEQRDRWKLVFEKFAEGNRKKWLILLGVLLIGVLILTKSIGKSKSTEIVVEKESSALVSEYQKQLEAELTVLLNQIPGAGSVQVMVTMDRGIETVYATEKKSSHQNVGGDNTSNPSRKQENNNSESSLILIKNADGSQDAVAVTEIQPKVKGVVVACTGANNHTVEQQITNAVSTAFHLSSTQVCVVQAK